MKPPFGLDAIVKFYGDPWAVMGQDGVLSPSEARIWEERLTFVPLPFPIPLAWGKPGQVARRLYVHKLAAPAFESVFRTLDSVDELKRKVVTYGGSYMFRPKRGDWDELSVHSWGIAIDLNVKGNELGANPTMHPGIVQVFEAAGFTWGGRWRRPDGMHFQLAGGY